MEVSYKQDAKHSFLVIQPDGEVDTKAYPLRMVLGNAISGLLPCTLHKVDEKVLFYYDITARQRILDVCRKFDYKQLKGLYHGFLKIFEQLDMYLLDVGQLLLEPEYIYMDKTEGELHLCYFPGYDKPIWEQLRCFTEYLLPYLDHKDSRGVILGYGLYRMLVEGGYQMEAIGELLYKSEQDLEEVQTPAYIQDQEVGAMNDLGNEKIDMDLERQGDGQRGKEVAFILTGLSVIGGVALLRKMGYLSIMTLPAMLAFIFCVILVAAFMVFRDKRKDLKKNDDIRREETRDKEELIQADLEATGGETVVLYKSAESEHPMLICEEQGQAPPIILNHDMVVVGKMVGVSDVLLDRPSISRLHARIQKKGQEFWIADLNSKNGTFVNGKKLEKEEERLLQPEDKVIFADINYRFVEIGDE
ncbi:MAG: FHA domain-containing protein [Lachnospiraceae bacterium]|nr:FHA domain-containing protein [Lachnospiraceae bacterium]